MKVMFVGDVTGLEAVDYVIRSLPDLRRDYGVGLVIANADNVAVTGPHPFGGSGMNVDMVERLLGGGVDVVTSGCHAFDGPESDRVLEMEGVLRPYNLPAGTAGRGLVACEVDGEAATVVNLAEAPEFFPEAKPIWEAWSEVEGRGAIVHLVGSVHSVRAFAYAVDGQAAAILGTLSHEATLHHYVLPGGTGLVPDVGMAGPVGGVGGFSPERFVAGLKGEDPHALPPYELLGGPTRLDAVLVRIEGGRCQEIGRLR